MINWAICPVAKNVKKFDTEEMNNAFERGKTVEEIAKYQNFDIPTTCPICETSLEVGSWNDENPLD